MNTRSLSPPARTPRVLGVEFAEEALAVDGVVLLGLAGDDLAETLHPALLALAAPATAVVLARHQRHHDQGHQQTLQIVQIKYEISLEPFKHFCSVLNNSFF